MCGMKKTDDALVIARRISEFLCDYAPQFLTDSEHTLKGYKDALVLYFQFLQENGVSPEVLSRLHLEKEWIEPWIVWLKDTRKNSLDTCNNRLASLRRFLEYLAEKDIGMAYLYQDSKRIKRQKCPKKKVSGLTRDAVATMLVTPDTSTRIGRRDLVLLTLLYATAARLDEIRSIKLGDIHLEAAKPYINLHGKGQKIRTAYLLPRAVALLKAYIKETNGQTSGADALLFPSRVSGHGKLTEAALDKRIKIYAAQANSQCKDVPLNAHAHLFRHYVESRKMVSDEEKRRISADPLWITHHFTHPFVRDAKNAIRSVSAVQSLYSCSGRMSLHAFSIAFLFNSVSILAYISVVEQSTCPRRSRI